MGLQKAHPVGDLMRVRKIESEKGRNERGKKEYSLNGTCLLLTDLI